MAPAHDAVRIAICEMKSRGSVLECGSPLPLLGAFPDIKSVAFAGEGVEKAAEALVASCVA